LNRWAESGSYTGARCRALVLLCAGTGLRLSEAVALDLGQLLVRPERVNGWQIKTKCVLRKEQIKGKREAAWFVIPEKIKPEIKAYIRLSKKKGWIKFPLQKTPLFFTYKNTGKGNGGQRLSKRTGQHDFKELQKMAAIADPYRFHDLRHTYQTNIRKAGCNDPWIMAQASRLRSIELTMTYAHTDYEEINEAVEKASELL
jgi:integrase